MHCYVFVLNFAFILLKKFALQTLPFFSENYIVGKTFCKGTSINVFGNCNTLGAINPTFVIHIFHFDSYSWHYSTSLLDIRSSIYIRVKMVNHSSW